jgi:hypothetical protein
MRDGPNADFTDAWRSNERRTRNVGDRLLLAGRNAPPTGGGEALRAG